MSSTTSNERSRSDRSQRKLDDPKYVLSRYMFYKKTCIELKEESESTRETLHGTKRNLDLRTLELIDANSELDAKESEIQNLTKQMENMKLSLDSLKRELNVKKDENTSLGNEIASLTLQVQEITLSKNVMEVKMNSQQQNLNAPNLLENSATKKCNSWWCPKHSELKAIKTKLVKTTLEEEKSITLALQRQRHWIRSGIVLCCVYDRKIGVDKHTDPPLCVVKYYEHMKSSQQGPSVFNDQDNHQIGTTCDNFISSSEDEF